VKAFAPHRFDARACRAELDALKALLDAHSDLDETGHVRPFFEQQTHAAALIGFFVPKIGAANLIAHQLDMGGDFACDLAIGNDRHKVYGLVEFEDGNANSVFRRNGQKATREWSPRFEHGFSQVVDWFHKLEDLKQTSAFEHLFGRNATYHGILVAGRSNTLSPSERVRLIWRSDKVLIDSKKVYCLTYDDLYEELDHAWSQHYAASSLAPDTDHAG
jgi:hypothetical protein